MTVDRCDTADLQRLIETLQIDPDLITVDIVENKVSANDENVEKATNESGKIESPSKCADESDTDNSTTPKVSTVDDNVVDSINTDKVTNGDDKKRKIDNQVEELDDINAKKAKKV